MIGREPTDDELLEELTGPTLPAHVYLHVPFCASRCSYCDFFSTVDLSPERVLPVTSALVGEAVQWASRSLPGVLETLYVGGGTPTILGSELARVVRDVLQAFPVRRAAEVTAEANPDSLTERLVEELAAAGVTRISVGVESFDDAELKLLGRVHSTLQAQEACRLVKDAGLELSVDLMCAIPGQTPSSWTDTLELAVATGAGHVSVYPLTVEDGTQLAAAVDAGLVEPTDPDVAADMLLLAERVLCDAGIGRYEVANYARPGHESRHNTAYWTGRPYLGLGPAAHGMLDGRTAVAVNLVTHAEPGERIRYANVEDLDRWVLGQPPEVEVLDAAQAAREDVMLGMRLVRGVPLAQVELAGVTDVMLGLVTDGLVERAEDRWRTTTRGWLLGNEVFGRIWAGE